MKWIEKGKEIEKIQMPDIKGKRFYIFGAGDIGRGLYTTLFHFGMFSGFIDNDAKKQNNGFCGQIVHSYQWFLDNGRDSSLIVAASEENEKVIAAQLNKDKCNFYLYELFLSRILPAFLLKENNILFMNLAQICVTERCTLKCMDCAHGCFAVNRNMKDMNLSEIYESVDTFFLKIDYIHEFVLIGGEPLLYQQLDEVVDYIGKKYRDKIGTFSITSNGTLLPSENLLKSCKTYGIYYRISNYVKAIPNLKKQYDRLVTLLMDNHIEYNLGKEEEIWWDYGFTDELIDQTELELICKFDRCQTPCREIRDGKLYYCVMARTISENLKFYIGENDYLDLRALPDGIEGKYILLEYNLGYSDKGYLDMCARCRGNESRNYPVMAARQL